MGVLSTLLARPDEVMLDLGAGGELLVARLRAGFSALILLLPLAGAARGAEVGETVIVLAAAVFVNIMAQAWLALARQRRQYPWLPYATCTYDIAVITGAMLLPGAGDSIAGVDGTAIWAFYLVAIATTALRNEGRLVLYAGAASIVLYAALAWIPLSGAAVPAQLVSPDYGAMMMSTRLVRLAAVLAMTVVTACVVYRMQRLVAISGRDGLTGLPNRAWLLQRIPRLLDGLRGGGSLTLALVDLDRFRRINDELGRIDGDRALRHAVAVIGQGLQDGEHLVRLGGEEFAVLLQCPMGTAWERIEHARRLLWEEPFVPGRGLDPQRLGFSAGLAAWPQDGGDLSSLLAAADRRQQASKRQGGNRVMARDP
jgi:diguanylate cyclase (GGDEF)-like protein